MSILSKFNFGSHQDMQLSARSNRVNKQLHNIGLVISIIMVVTTLILLLNVIFKVMSANNDFVGGSVDYKTMSNINQIVASLLLMMVTSMTAIIFFRLYRAQSPFSRGNIFIIRVIAVILMLLSILPILVQVIVGGFFHISIKMSINFIYIFIGVIFYCISYVFEHGDVIQKKTDEIINVQEDVILAFAELSEAKSGQTGQHVKRVSEYTRILARNMGMSESEVENLRLASMMHDVGKLMIPNEILEKESSLTDEEFAIMKTHVVAGEQLLHNATGPVMEKARKMALEHHEHWDGNGYLGKKGEEISQEARIVAVADVFDALISARSYKSGWDPNKVYHLICDDSGKKFDPAVVKVFIQSYKEMLEVYNRFNKTASREHQISEETMAGYDKILGEYSDKNKNTNDSVVSKSQKYQDVELDLRRLI